jgi:UDP-glucose 4-epimerase
MDKVILITGASGFVGSSLLELFEKKSPDSKIIGTDLREPRREFKLTNFQFVNLDVRDPGLPDLMEKHKVTHVVHLASIVSPGKKSNRELEFSVDVIGTKNVISGCLKAKSRQLIVTSSGAAYGYYPDNAEWLKESDKIRGNYEFPYSYHKRLVEEEMKVLREKHPELKQLILRPGTILGKNVNNQITDLFRKPVIMGIQGSDTPFVFIWDEDVVEIIYQGVMEEKVGIYNLAADGAVKMKEIAKILKKPYLPIPAFALSGALKILKEANLTQYGPEQINFLRYRPVLANEALKNIFGYKPKKSSLDYFKDYARSQNLLK